MFGLNLLPNAHVDELIFRDFPELLSSIRIQECILEAIGFITLIISFFYLNINYESFLYLTIAVYLFYLNLTIISILLDEILYKHYSSVKEILILIMTAIIEPIFYHPINVYASLKGYYHFFRQKEQAWGNMQRQGFNTQNDN